MAKRIWRTFIWIVTPLALVAAVFGVEILLALQGKREKPYVNPSHAPVSLGNSGTQIRYVVTGDSTAAGQGAPYLNGIAMGTAEHLAKNHRVTMVNLAVSGAVIADVVREQLAQAAELKPDVVLLSVGANDATHFTSASKIRAGLETIISGLRKASPSVTIIVTGCPQMGSVPRFLFPLRWFAGTQTARVNDVFSSVVAERHLIWSRIADRTGPIFEQDPTLFANDKFHPNERGYAVWLMVLNETLDEAVKPQGRD